MSNMNGEGLNSILEQYMDSEITCCKNRKIYSALENILIRKDYLQNLDLVSQMDEMKINNNTLSKSNHRLSKNKSLTKVMTNREGTPNTRKNVHASTPDNKNFTLVRKQIHQFESYKNCISRVSDKYSKEFLHLLEAQNWELSQSTNCN